MNEPGGFQFDFIKIASTFGLPVVMLVLVVIGIWRTIKFVLVEIALPLTRQTIATQQKTIQHMDVQEKATAGIRDVLDKLADNQDKIIDNLDEIHKEQRGQ